MSAETQKEVEQLKKTFQNLAKKSYRQNVFAFTGFLSLAEQDALQEVVGRAVCGKKSAGSACVKTGGFVTLWGGNEDCERRMARFGSAEEFGYEEDFPIAALKISPLSEKFAEDCSHRDFLGALMHLGIDRSTVGDIFLEGKHAWIFCTETIAPFLCENLDRVRHTAVRCEMLDKNADAGKWPAPRQPEPARLVVSANRADAVAAKAFSLSRSQSLELFRAGKVYVNGRVCGNNSQALKARDVVSVRGFGRFVFLEEGEETRKGRLSVTVGLYR